MIRVDFLNALLFSIVLIGIVWRGTAVARVALDARRRNFASLEIIRWMLVAIVADDRYWWGGRLDRLPVLEARELLIETAQAHGLSSVVNVRCPLCDYEIANALAMSSNGELYIRRKTVCARCDFRLDACRHCEHFQPAGENTFGFDRKGDFSHGRCGFYRAVEAVRTAYPQHARQLEAMGYDMLPTPKAIVDSFVPLDECTAFSLKRDLLRYSKVPWIDRQRVALVRLHQKIGHTR